ncbi:MAG: hypothetical protein FJZ62_02075 [Chlamydiae bacterium]|nr:hypothetical protein [Chlamydiota bacterium]
MANNDPNRPKKEGVSVEEMQSFFKNYGAEISLSLIFILSAISARYLFGMETWCIILLGLGGIIGTLLPQPIRQGLGSAMKFSAGSGNKYGQLAIAIVAIVISIVVSPLAFLIFGLVAGETLVMAKKGQ